jgi:hypothetical protein
MNYSQLELEAMGEDRINSIVHEINHPLADKGNAYASLEKSISSSDYCSNPSDAWPIIVENGISLIKSKYLGCWDVVGKGLYTHEGFESSVGAESENKNPLRAACIVFILMKQDKENKCS